MGCNCDPCNDNNPISIGSDTARDLLFIDTDNIRFEDIINVNGQREIRAFYEPYVAPLVAFTVSPSIIEVGSTTSATFTLNVTKTSKDIISRTLSPPEGLTGVEGVFSFVKIGVTSNVQGLLEPHTLTVQDDSSEPPVVLTVGVKNRFKVFQGYSLLSTLNEAAIEGLANVTLDDSIKVSYGGTRPYTLPFVFQYVYWVYPVGTEEILALEEGPLSVPLYFGHPNIVVTNSFGVSQAYRVIRTANGFGNGTANFTMI